MNPISFRAFSSWKTLAATSASLVLLSGCASVSVRNVTQRAESVRKPTTISVADFKTGGGSWKITSRTFDRAEFKRRLASALTADLVKNLHRFVGPAVFLSSEKSPPPGSWVVTGRFTRVEEGSPLGRIIVGLGVGASKVETETAVAQAADPGRPFLGFATTGGSNAMPGAALNTNPLSVVTTGIGQLKLGMRDDTNRTAKMITAAIAHYLTQRGWLAKERVKPKTPGQYQLLQPQISPASSQPSR